MINIYQPQSAKIISIRRESVDTHLLRLVLIDKKAQKEFNFLPGQFVQIGLAGWGECPISICSSPTDSRKFFELGIRDAGSLTHKLTSLCAGDEVYIRGPFGNGFDTDNFHDQDLLLIGGGCGFVPLRPLIIDYVAGRLAVSKLQIFYGCLNEDTILFKDEQAVWRKKSDLSIILDKPSAKWKGAKGLVTALIQKNKLSQDTVVVMVGPPIMYRFAIAELLKKGIKPENIWLSLERKMYCGLGVCQHCAIGPYYVCKDGPIFTYSQLKDIPNAI